MKKLLLTSVFALATAATASANIIPDVIGNLGPDPASSQGNFSSGTTPLSGPFDEQFTFTLSQAMTLTIASATNTFASGVNSAQFITNFTGSVWSGTPSAPGTEFIGPVAATMNCGMDCQGFGGSAFLDVGTYFLDITGSGGGNAGYSGNLSTFSAVPGPVLGTGLPGLFILGMVMLGWRRCHV